MGEVFEATHARLPGRYAVKILRPELLGNREAFARFCREAEVMSELRHPNVVQIYDFNTTPEGRPYFVMEHLEGRDLEARLTQSGPMPLPAAVRVVDAVASALATAHAHGIVHRDLKPANIFLVAIDGQIDELVKVLDFGISKIRSAGTLLSSPTDMIGSPAYMSPEQARGASDEIDGRSDQFALGAITYRMLTGFEPFQGDDIASLLYQVVHEEAPRLARTLPAWWDTRALQAVLDRALAKEPAQRFSGMVEMARAFEAASEQTLSHEMADRGTVNLGATLIAAPPPPPLRPARTPAAASGGVTQSAYAPSGIEDSAPPIRTPAPEPVEALEPSQSIRAATPRPRPARDFSVDEGATVPQESLSPEPGLGRAVPARAAPGHASSGGARRPRSAGDRRHSGRHRHLPSRHLGRSARARARPPGAGADLAATAGQRPATGRSPERGSATRGRLAPGCVDGPAQDDDHHGGPHRGQAGAGRGALRAQAGQVDHRRVAPGAGGAFPSPPHVDRATADRQPTGERLSPRQAHAAGRRPVQSIRAVRRLAVRRRTTQHRAVTVRAAEPVHAAAKRPAAQHRDAARSAAKPVRHPAAGADRGLAVARSASRRPSRSASPIPARLSIRPRHPCRRRGPARPPARRPPHGPGPRPTSRWPRPSETGLWAGALSPDASCLPSLRVRLRWDDDHDGVPNSCLHLPVAVQQGL